ncbi:MAG: thiamine pyrophosphate-binding protein [Anaerolineaceae bacterium]|nr:thiamine pyrophosphate-binding protein [Anaerolineaceae bacterium]
MNGISSDKLQKQRKERAKVIFNAGGLRVARQTGVIPRQVNLTLSEALVLGLIDQGVRTFYSVFGHGSTEVGEVLRIYHEAGMVKVYGVRNEIEASHAAAALRWVCGEKAAVVTSIGPGAVQALAASLVPTSDGIGVWYLFGDETTEDEGFNMQQIPRHQQAGFLKLTSVMGSSYSLHTPLALPAALRFGNAVVDHPFRPGPFYLLLPMNTQAAIIKDFNLDEICGILPVQIGRAEGDYQTAAKMIQSAIQIVIKAGGGAVGAREELEQLLQLSGGVLVHTPIATGCIPYSHPANMGVGGSKGSLCGNYAMENTDLLIAVGTRAVCQSDSSRTAYPKVKQVININADIDDAQHYNCTLPLVGDIRSTLAHLNMALEKLGMVENKDPWLAECGARKTAWREFKAKRIISPVLYDDYWQQEVLTQPAVIKTALDWAKTNQAVSFFDAGDVQANGFQLVEDEEPGKTFTETGASYMGFAVSALLATGTASRPFYGLAFSGDGSFTMNPQILIDGVEHGARGGILLLDNGRMAAISGLQTDQYSKDFSTSNRIKVDYLAWARAVPGILALDAGQSLEKLKDALDRAGRHPGLSMIRVKVYYGPNELGGMGVYGRWNVGNWCEDTQQLRHEIGL